MKLPNGEQAEIAMEKLINYCLNTEHRRGKHKARRFKSALGITKENADYLHNLIKISARKGIVIEHNTTNFGEEFKVDLLIPDSNNIILRTIWEVKKNQLNPRLISAFIK